MSESSWSFFWSSAIRGAQFGVLKETIWVGVLMRCFKVGLRGALARVGIERDARSNRPGTRTRLSAP